MTNIILTYLKWKLELQGKSYGIIIYRGREIKTKLKLLRCMNECDNVSFQCLIEYIYKIIIFVNKKLLIIKEEEFMRLLLLI